MIDNPRLRDRVPVIEQVQVPHVRLRRGPAPAAVGAGTNARVLLPSAVGAGGNARVLPSAVGAGADARVEPSAG